jgi:2-polyprenyl-3-methyl-5-hydroxy-6-metoxy-1,4-benzoquinol methylase
MLVLKSINGDLRLSELERLRAMVGGRSDVRILDAYYTEEEKNALLGACDCYVSLHRSEGLGLTMAEAMALGKPVIATGYSGNLHFMTPENSYLVDYSRVNVPAGCEPYPTTAFWAEPNIGQAAEYMREVYEQPAIADRKAGKARRDILERHNRETSARVIRRRVEAIREERRRRIVGFGTGTSEGAAKASTAASPAVPGVAQLEALLPALTETATLRLSAEGRSLPGVRIRAQRAFFRVLRPLWFQQHQFHTHLVNALRLTTAALRSEQRARELTDARLQELTRNAAAQLAGLTTAVQQTEAGLATLTQKLYATPYMSDPNRFLEKDPQGRARMGYRASDRTDREGFYVGFEEVFRGPEALIRERQRAYLPILRTRRAVVDLGCGRGEMLDVLREAGVAGTGVDIDADMVRHCRTKGHAVEERDALEYLRAQEPNSVEALFSAQVIEHLPFGALKEFLQLCRSRLRPGGVLIAETVNPHALEAFKTFYTDLTHQRPIFPEVALAFCQLAGFEEAHIFFPLGSGDLKEDRRSRGEYAIVATAGSVR